MSTRFGGWVLVRAALCAAALSACTSDRPEFETEQTGGIGTDPGDMGAGGSGSPGPGGVGSSATDANGSNSTETDRPDSGTGSAETDDGSETDESGTETDADATDTDGTNAGQTDSEGAGTDPVSGPNGSGTDEEQTDEGTASPAADPCTPNPCLNSGSCTADGQSFSCECAAGFSGDACETNVDDCTPNPCLNSGSCIDGVNAFTCTCPVGFGGTTCEVVVDDCEPDPCVNGGTCDDSSSMVTCMCLDGFSGSLCEINDDDCTPNPCVSGAICTDGIDSYVCNCASGTKLCDDACIANSACCESAECGTNEVCNASNACVCATNFKDCDGTCIANSACCDDGDCAATASCESNSCVCDAGYSGDDCDYYFSGLGFVSGHVASEAYGVSADGSTVVGASYASAGGTPTAFRWRATGMMSLGFLSGGGESIAYATSSNGDVVVGDAENSSGELVAFRWAGSMTALPLADYGSYSTGRDVSDDGTVIVGWGDRDGEHRALRWLNGSVSTYGSIDPLYFHAVSPNGSVFAGRMVNSPMVYDSAATQVGTLTGYTGGEVLSLTAVGTTRGVGYLNGSTNDRAVRWSGGGDASDLGTLTGSSRALDVSADGTIIVGASSNQAFVWDSGNGMRSLTAVLDAAGVNLSGWSLVSATGVSSDGRTIVGYGTHNGATEAFIAVLP